MDNHLFSFVQSIDESSKTDRSIDGVLELEETMNEEEGETTEDEDI